MKVYSGRQYGNNFNSGDEGLFQDANRPRDNDMFKLRPGLQSDKRKEREVNKDITTQAAELVAECSISGVTANSSIPNGSTIPKLTEQKRFGDPGCIVNSDGNIEIVEDGTYIIQAFTQFLLPSAPNNGYNYVESVSLLKHKTGNYTGFPRRVYTLNQSRMCGSGDQLVAWTVGRLTKGAIFNVGANHTYGSSISLYQVMNVQRLA